MYDAFIYFAGERSRWAGCPDRAEIIAHFRSPWRWFTRLQVRNAFSQLDDEKCGYALTRGEEVLEHYEPPVRVSKVEVTL